MFERIRAPFALAPTAAQGLRLRAAVIAAVAAGSTLVAAPAADARITRIDITTTESPTFGGYSWPGVGQYEKLAGKAYGELNPTDPKNAVIADIALAPRNADGNVEYAVDFYILKPIDLAKGNHKMMYEPPNRGRKTWNALARMPSGNDPGSVTNEATLAQSFLMPRGYTMMWSGWDQSAGTDNSNFNTTITLPVAKNADGSSITGPSYEYFIGPGDSYDLTYPAASLDQSTAKLTHRVHLEDTPDVVPATGWAYNADGTSISLTGGASFVTNDIYEFSYTAKDPTVNGVGFAAIRDFVAFMRYESVDDEGNANPLAGDVQFITTEISSQPGRLLNDFDHLGFNQAENGKKVFDAHMNWIAAGDGVNMNLRFSQPGRTNRNRQDLLYIEGRFPFASVSTTDPISGETDGRYVKCAATNTCPLVAQIYSANEYWVKAASLLHTTPDGTADLPDAANERNYFISSHQHGTGSATSKGACQQFLNPLDSSPVQRAMFLALDDWANKHIMPPPSMVPKFSNHTFAASTSQADVGFPSIPGVTYTGLKTTRYRFDYGPNFYSTGIMTINPPVGSGPIQTDNPAWGPIYPSFVPTTDADGNDIAGVRLPDVTVPLATYTGWAVRAGPQANDGCEGSGQYIPFAKTLADRTASGDPRKSIEERYPNFSSYYFSVNAAVNNFVAHRWMLPEDANAALNRMLNAGYKTGAIKLDGKWATAMKDVQAQVDAQAATLEGRSMGPASVAR
jgi:hypothetical protein